MPWKSGLNVNCLNPNCLHDVSHTNIYIQLIVHFPTLRSSKLSNLYSSLNGWHDISSTNIYFQLTHITQYQSIPWIYSTDIYSFNWIFPNPAPEGLTENLQITFVPKGWHYISNITIYFQLVIYSWNCIFHNPVHEGRTETLQLTFFPWLAWYIQHQYIFLTEIYSPNCGLRLSNTNLYFKKSLFPNPFQQYIHPARAGMIYPIPIYIFNWLYKLYVSQPCARRVDRNSSTW